MSETSFPSGRWFKFKNLSKKEKRILITRHFLLPFLSTMLVMIAQETIKDGATLFFTIWLIGLAFVLVSYALIKFKPLANESGRKGFFSKILYVTVNSIIYMLSIVIILTKFVYGHDIPLLSFDYQTQILSIYMQKVTVYLFVYFTSWIISNLISKLIFK